MRIWAVHRDADAFSKIKIIIIIMLEVRNVGGKHAVLVKQGTTHLFIQILRTISAYGHP